MAPKKKDVREAAPASTPEGREIQMVNLAVELAERQLRDGTASSAVITHYLKLGSQREIIERDILEKQAKLIDAKAQSIVKEKEQEEIAKKALQAMKNYTSGSQ